MKPSVNIGSIVEFQRTKGDWVPAVVETVYNQDTVGLSFLYRGKWEFRNVSRGDKVEQFRTDSSSGPDDVKTQGGVY